MAFAQSESCSYRTARNRYNRLTAGQWQTSHIMYCWEHWCSQWFGAQSEGCIRDTKLLVRSPGKPAFCRGQWDASYTKTFSKSAWRNNWSMIGKPTEHHWSSN